MNRTVSGIELPTAELVQVDQALESMRDSGFDLPAAAGEAVDNSIEAKATIVRIKTIEGTQPVEGRSKGKPKLAKTIDAIVFADNGVGIKPEILSHALTLGYSTRYNQREGLGRFGVGMKLAAINIGKRIDIYTRPFGGDQILHAFVDLTLIKKREQTVIKGEIIEDYPLGYRDLMFDPISGEPFESGTLLVWSNIDRLAEGGKYASSIDEHVQNLKKFLARAYREFIDKGLLIELNERQLTLYDPLFLLENPRVTEYFGEDLRAKTVDETEVGQISIDGHDVSIRVTLYPKRFREIEGAGARPERAGEEFKHLYIPEHQGRVSILRNGREIYYDIVPRLFPGGVDKPDRFIGVEVSFPAALDEYFQVRHVKRGAEPISKLREQIRGFIKRPIQAARKEIRQYWHQVETSDGNGAEEHKTVLEAVKRAERTTPRGKAGLNLSADDEKRVVEDLLADLGIDPSVEPKKIEEVKERIKQNPINLFNAAWPGKELFEIIHLNGKAIIKLNHRHPFMREVYKPLKDFSLSDPSAVDAEDGVYLAQKVRKALEVFFMAYAKAENMHPEPDKQYDKLRTYWGQFTQAYLEELLQSS